MAINQIGFQSFNPNSLVDQGTWTGFGNLRNVYQQAQTEAFKKAKLSQLTADPNANMELLLRSGDPDLATLGLKLQDTLRGEGRQDKRYEVQDRQWGQEFGLRQNQDKRATNQDVRAGYADQRDAERLDLAKEKAERENRSLSEIFQERHDAWVLKGFKPEGPGYEEFMTNGSTTSATSANKAGLTPIYGTRTGADGKEEVVPMQATGTGEMKESKLPPGVKISNKVRVVDRGTFLEEVNPITNEVIRVVPKDLSGVAQQKTQGEDLAKAKAALPNVELNAEFVKRNIDDLVSHKGKNAALGFQSYFPTVRGSEASGFEQRLEQIKGRAFLSAYDTLRGAGQISEGEGKAATNALTRAQTASSVKEFDAAMAEFKEYTDRMLENARAKATGGVKTDMGSGADAVVAKVRAAKDSGVPKKDLQNWLLGAGLPIEMAD
jgi:hypothetical protein